jgi:hypothetical protein
MVYKKPRQESQRNNVSYCADSLLELLIPEQSYV